MKKLILLLSFVFFTGFINAQNVEEVINKDHSIDSNKVILPEETNERVAQVITRILSRYHFRKEPLSDTLSSLIFDQYIKNLDNSRLYFLKKDINQFEKYRYEFDNYLETGDLNVPFEIFNLYKKRLGERVKYVEKILEHEFDFTKDEYFRPDRDSADWAETEEELNELWRLRLKNDALNLMLSGKDWKGAVDVLLKRYRNYHKIILQYESEDVFSVFMNSVTQVYDPHSDYLSPSASDNFDISMKLSLEGIGATLRQDYDYTVVVSIVPGGPADKSGLLHADDKIIGVAQGEDGEMVDVVGWRLDDVIKLIRGKKGTLVRLLILKAEDGVNAQPTEIKIIRDEVKLEEQAAKSEIINIEEEGLNFKLGVIKLPSFYSDFEAQQKGLKDYRSTTRDVKKILDEFKKEKVDGVILDLRNNGGGSLQEAINLTGLFIKAGPVVQVKNIMNIIEVNSDRDSNIYYDGPLAVLVNRFSASASEILSGAIQDYGRGLVIGENTFGKGTVQNLLDLNSQIPIKDKKLGKLKLTIAKFYRVTGNSTQNKGVEPDVAFPSPYESKEFGESAYDRALPYDTINPVQYEPYDNLTSLIPLLEQKHERRAQKDPEYHFLLEEIKEFKKNRQKKLFTLNLEKRKAEKEKADAEKKRREEEKAKLLGIDIKEKKETSAEDSWIKDYELKETGRILADFILAKVG
ncbi:carboxy terminal-processing peptidase [Melioribacter sp. Ez-97]|uniref:carboxy terminal-processing peptidase n=1 Tax=Melioribacter sp. Ez-97 TaxID=3423434 RepID=UPI003ED98999